MNNFSKNNSALALLKGDLDLKNYIAAVEAADGQVLEDCVKNAYAGFISGCKQDGIWNSLQACCIMAGARTLSGALVPLRGAAPTNFNFVSADYNRKTGLIGNGTTKYLDSNLAGSATTTHFHMSSYMSTGLVTGRAAMGRTDSKGYHTWIWSRTGGYANKAYPYVGPNPTGVLGFIGHNRNGFGALINKRQGGITTSNDSAATYPMDSGTFKIFCYDGNGTLSAFCNSRMAYYSIGGSLDIEKLDSRVTTLITTIGACSI